MKKIYRIVTLSLLLIGICDIGLAVSGSGHRQSARVTAEDWPPWEKVNARGEITGGIAIELVEEMLSRMNIEMKTENVPFKRALAYLEIGRSDFILMIAPSPERAKFMTFTDPIRVDYERLYYSTERFPAFEWNVWKDLTPYSMGTVRGYVHGKNWQQAANTYHYKVSVADTDFQNLRMLLRGRIDFMIILESAVGGILDKMPEARDKIKYASKPVLEVPLCFGLSKKSSLAPRLSEMNSALRQMRHDGTFKRILKDYYQETE